MDMDKEAVMAMRKREQLEQMQKWLGGEEES